MDSKQNRGARPSVRAKILSRLTEKQKRQLRLCAIVCLMSGGAFATLGAVSDEAPPPAPLAQSLQLTNTRIVSLDDEARGVFREERVQRGDTLASVLARLGVSDSGAFQYLRGHPDARALTNNLRPGRALRAETDANGALVNLSYALSPTEKVTITRDRAAPAAAGADTFSTAKTMLQAERRLHMKSAEIRTSLFGAADAAGLPDSVTIQIAEMFAGDIDFHKDIRRGDRFGVVYEMLYHEGEFVKAGRVLAAEFVNNGKRFAAVWYDNPDDKDASGYYTPEGKNLRKAFLRSPLEFSRMTSGFGGRMHPIHNVWKQHNGVDYGAPTGTRIRTIGDGVVDFAGKQGGYGNVVVVRHQGQYSTLYAHMSAFASGIAKGTRVSQGDTIGLVGQTGWATGPHLHYEFRIADAAVNPLTVTLPAALPLEAHHQADFFAKSAPLAQRMALLRERYGAGAVVTAAANFE